MYIVCQWKRYTLVFIYLLAYDARMNDGKLITVSQAADALSLHRTRVHALIKAGRLPAIRTGSVLLIREADLALVADRKPGRPPKAEVKPESKPAKKAAKKAARKRRA